MKINELFEQLNNAKNYLLTATILDKEKQEGDLRHFIIREEFPTDDIVPSLDKCIGMLNIRPVRPLPVITPSEVEDDVKPLKIAIITHFNRCPDSYSPGRAVKNQIKLLMKYGHEVVFFTQEGSKVEVDCEIRRVVPAFKREKGIVNEEIKNKFIDILREHLTADFDIAITHDFYIDDCITYREAIRECNVDIPWLHWARSGVGRPIDFRMSNARYVYMNYADTGRFSRAINVDQSLIRVVFNEKDPSLFFGWHPITKMINDKMRLWDKDIIQIYPICTTRMDAKGVNSIIRTFGLLKELGNKVALIICNSNGRKRQSEIEAKIEFAKQYGLTEEDFLFTSTLSTEDNDTATEVPNIVVSQLMQISNLFIFPTIAEVCSNVLLEASMAKTLLVLNEDLPSLFDFADKSNVLYHKFTSLQSVHFQDRSDDDLTKLAKQINGQIKSNKPDLQMRRVWRTHNFDTIYKKMLLPILLEKLEK